MGKGGLAGALFTPVQQRVLGLLFGQPERRFQSAELIRLAGSGTGAVHRQLQRLAATGLVEVSHAGNQKYYQANRESPIYPELHSLVVKTMGIGEPLRVALNPLADRIRAAFVFGSVAKGSDRAGSDLDLLVISDNLGYAHVYAALQSAEIHLARPVNPKVMTWAEWKQKRARRDSFAARIAAQPKLFVISVGSTTSLSRLPGRGLGDRAASRSDRGRKPGSSRRATRASARQGRRSPDRAPQRRSYASIPSYGISYLGDFY